MTTKYLTKFNTEAEYNEFINGNLAPYVNVSYIQATDENKYYKEEDTFMMQPFTMHIDRLSNGESVPLCFFVQRDPSNAGVQSYCRYKINNNSWQSFTFTINDDPWKGDDNIRLYEGDTVQIICKTNSFNSFGAYRDWHDLQCSFSGNIMSLFFGDDYVYAPANKLPFPQIPYDTGGYKIDHIYIRELIGAGGLLDASDLWLPTRNLPEGIFKEMFKDCVNLTAGPDIKAKYLPKDACRGMFKNCSSMTDMPLVLAETCEETSLDDMFNACSSLVNTTQLHVKKFIRNNMNGMFAGCTSLVTAPIWNEDVIFEDIDVWAWWAFNYIFEGCSLLEDTSTFYIRANDALIFDHQYFGFNNYAPNCPNLRSLFKMGFSTPSDGLFIFPARIPDENNSTILQPNGEIYILTTTGEIQIDGNSDRFINGGTLYVLPGSRYLPGGDLYGQLPSGLPSNWTVAEYVQPSN